MARRTPPLTTSTKKPPVPPPAPPIVANPGVQLVGQAPPDVKDMVPNAAVQLAQVVVVVAAPAPPPVPVYQPKKTLANWSIDYLFNGYEGPDGVFHGAPVNDRMSMLLAATLARQAYVPYADPLAQLSQALAGAGVQRYWPVGDTAATYDVWQIDQARSVFVFPGTTTMNQWLSYALPLLKTRDYLPVGVTMWAGIADQVERWRSEVLTRWADRWAAGRQTIFVGHSLGGAVAATLAQIINKAYFAANPSAEKGPIVGTYTFGAPAYLSFSRPANSLLYLSNALRIFNPGDPVPDAVQLYLSNYQNAISPASLFGGVYPLARQNTWHVCDDEVNTLGPKSTSFLKYVNESMQIALTGGAALTQRLAEAHTITSYCALLDSACRGRGDVPYNVYSAVAQANNLFTKLGQ